MADESANNIGGTSFFKALTVNDTGPVSMVHYLKPNTSVVALFHLEIDSYWFI